MTYTCTICHSVNHVKKLSCSVCGSVPAKYSIQGDVFNHLSGRPVVVARGAVRQAEHHLARVFLRTVSADYYAEGM